MVSHAAGLRPRQPLGHPVDGDDLIAQVRGDPSRHVADRAEPQHRHRTAVGNVGVRDCLPCRRQHVGEVDEPRVRRPVRDLDVGELGLRDAQQFGLAAGHLAVEFGVAEQRGAHALVADLRGLTLGVELLVAHIATAAGDLERDHHPVADGEIGDAPPTSRTMPIGSWPRMSPGVHERAEHLVEMQVGAADVGRRHLDDRVGRLLDLRIGDGVDAHVPFAVPGDCFHRNIPSGLVSVSSTREDRWETAFGAVNLFPNATIPAAVGDRGDRCLTTTSAIR